MIYKCKEYKAPSHHTTVPAPYWSLLMAASFSIECVGWPRCITIRLSPISHRLITKRRGGPPWRQRHGTDWSLSESTPALSDITCHGFFVWPDSSQLMGVTSLTWTWDTRITSRTCYHIIDHGLGHGTGSSHQGPDHISHIHRFLCHMWGCEEEEPVYVIMWSIIGCDVLFLLFS